MGRLHRSSERRRRSLVRLSAVGWLVALAVGEGCGARAPFPGAVKVTGIARFEGAPLTRGTVQFGAVAGNDGGTARIGPHGGFTVWLRPGEYRASVIAFDGIERVDDKGIPLPQKAVIPERYFSTDTSGLTASIEKDRHTLEFELRR